MDSVKTALANVHQGKTVECSTEDYPKIRKALQDAAGNYIDTGDPMRGMIALEEVRRLDSKFDWPD